MRFLIGLLLPVGVDGLLMETLVSCLFTAAVAWSETLLFDLVGAIFESACGQMTLCALLLLGKFVARPICAGLVMSDVWGTGTLSLWRAPNGSVDNNGSKQTGSGLERLLMSAATTTASLQQTRARGVSIHLAQYPCAASAK